MTKIEYGHTLVRNVTELDEAGWVQFIDVVRRINATNPFPDDIYTITDDEFSTPNPVLEEHRHMRFRVLRVGEVGDRTFTETCHPDTAGNRETVAYIHALLYSFPGAFTWRLPERNVAAQEDGVKLFGQTTGVPSHLLSNDDLSATVTFGDDALAEYANTQARGVEGRRVGSSPFVRISGDKAEAISLRELIETIFGGEPEDRRTDEEKLRNFEEEELPRLVNGRMFDLLHKAYPARLREQAVEKTQGPPKDLLRGCFNAIASEVGPHPHHLVAVDKRGALIQEDLGKLPIPELEREEMKAYVSKLVRTCFAGGAVRVVFVICGEVKGQHCYVGYLYEPDRGLVMCGAQPTGEEGLVGEVEDVTNTEGSYFEMKAVN